MKLNNKFRLACYLSFILGMIDMRPASFDIGLLVATMFDRFTIFFLAVEMTL